MERKLNPQVYVIISTAKSSHYTQSAIDSFFKSTKLYPKDEVYVINNDNVGLINDPRVSTINNLMPKGFAKNINDMLHLVNGKDVFVLNNDIIFTPNWNEPLLTYNNIISMPTCNQIVTYTSSDGLLSLEYNMTLSQYNSWSSLLDIVEQHKKNVSPLFYETMLMPFYAVRIPANVYSKVGIFDESFGVGGGEDVDYKLRALQKNIATKYYSHSYLLHFGGQSTWVGETHDQTNDRDKFYHTVFEKKWNIDLADICLANRGSYVHVLKKYNVEDLFINQKYSDIIKYVLNNSTVGN